MEQQSPRGAPKEMAVFDEDDEKQIEVLCVVESAVVRNHNSKQGRSRGEMRYFLRDPNYECVDYRDT